MYKMVRQIVKDELFLAQKSEIATKADVTVITDLIDTLRANAGHCVGMAANMIGIKKSIIVFSVGIVVIPMVNPVIIRKSGEYETEEGCLSLNGVRKTTRFEKIEAEFQDKDFKKQRQGFTGWTAQIIQHEMDHLEGQVI